MSSWVTSLWKLPVSRSLDLAARLAKLRLDVLQAQALVDPLLGCAAFDLFGLGVLDPVLGHREAHLDRALPQLDVVGRRTGEVLKEVAVGLWRDYPQVDGDAVLGRDPGAAPAGVPRRRPRAGARPERSPAPSGPSRWRSGPRPCTSRPAAALSRRPRPPRTQDVRADPLRASRRSGKTSERRTRSAGPSAPSFSSCAAMFSSALGPRPFIERILSGRRLPGEGRRSKRLLSRRCKGVSPLGPSPGMRVTSTRVAGNFALSFSAEGIVPVSRNALIFSADVLPIPERSVTFPARVRSAMDTGDWRMVLAASRYALTRKRSAPSSS